MTPRTKLFISHSTADDAFVRELREALADQGQDGWIDSRELRGGDLLWPMVWWAMQKSSAFIVVVSPAALQSKWVGKELRQALKLQKKRGKDYIRSFRSRSTAPDWACWKSFSPRSRPTSLSPALPAASRPRSTPSWWRWENACRPMCLLPPNPRPSRSKNWSSNSAI